MNQNKKILGIISVVVIFTLIITNAVLFSMYINKSNINEDSVYVEVDADSTRNTANYVITYMKAKQCSSLHYVPNTHNNNTNQVLNCGYEDCEGSQCKYITNNLLE